MHEMSLAAGILKLVEDAAQREHFARVTRLKLEAGALSGVEVRSLRFALESMVAGTVLERARIEVDEPPGTAWCLQCSGTVAIQTRLEPCPACGSQQLQPTGGTELRVVEMLVEDA